MSFISYSQNYEDVMLWRALKHVKNGFYIDVGANDPEIDSVTKAFYERGWHGINLEPIKWHHQSLLAARPNDINLCCAAGSANGQIDVWECDVRGWGTAAPDVVKKHQEDGHSGVFHKVPLLPLKEVCKKYVKGAIHFLKIDVEGLEKDVLEGMDFEQFRPWIVLVESTKPNSDEQVYLDWEDLIVSNNYVFAYADGLNRFYVSKEQSVNLLHLLRYPPNVFDQFIGAQHHKALKDLSLADERQIKLQIQLDAVLAQLDAVLAQLDAVLKSKSWRMTAPLRWSVQQILLLRNQVTKHRTKAALKNFLRK